MKSWNGGIMKILDIKKIGKNKYEIKLEHETITTYDTIMLKYKITLKKELPEMLIDAIKEETKKAEILNHVIKFIGKKQRSEKEVRAYLQKKNVEEIDEIIELLQEQNLFHELSYIEAYIHDRFMLSNDGPFKIKADLLKEDFDEEKVNLAIEKISEEKVRQKLSKLIEKRINHNHKYSENYLKQKIENQMQQLGYSKEMIDELLEVYQINHLDTLKYEAQKLYAKYKNKKNDNELILYIKQKLFQKQYPIEEINQILEEITLENEK